MEAEAAVVSAGSPDAAEDMDGETVCGSAEDVVVTAAAALEDDEVGIPAGAASGAASVVDASSAAATGEAGDGVAALGG